ncbi:hypothetical protein A1351_02420 [Methylosinus sp. R-45379]|uniref:outer membrane protein n=1 Tax=unclassified Methylosinus TaxID=2624500 RepID=UPI00046526C1|nr:MULTISPECIES: outer membrane beta-barrel protein [unclassified Methylosinus]OAI24861.1 hypothetical protein A1351_02420 [Methylosinus sp. R-45379]TDX66903.1 outer membrane immunogenic protein [Methylosinus sp. sav-2]
MKYLPILAAALLSFSTARAADLGARRSAPPALAPPPAFLYSGFYVGAQAGWLGYADRAHVFAPNDVSLARVTARGGGFVGGVHAGYDWRVGPLVLGLVGDVSGARAVGNAFEPFGVAIRDQLGAQGSLRARVGYAFDRLLIYATGGLNVADARHDYRAPWASDSRHFLVAAPTVGVGVEYAFTDRWSGRLEYRVSGVGAPRETSRILPSTLVRHEAGAGAATVGVSYRFGP